MTAHRFGTEPVRTSARPSTPSPSPPAALIESALALIGSANTLLRAVLDNRVPVEQAWRDPRSTTYRVIVTPEEKS